MKRISLLLFWVAFGVPVSAQNYVYDTGNLPFTTRIPIDNGYIDVNNGEVHLEFPLATQTERGRIPLHESIEYDSRIWKIANNSGFYYYWTPTNIANSYGGWRLSDGLEINEGATTPTYYTNVETWTTCNGQQYPSEEAFTNFAWTDPQDSNHLFPGSFLQQIATPCNSTVTPNSTSGTALDGSGYSMTMTYDTTTGNVDTVVFDRQGNEVYPLLQDPNGNYFEENGSYELIDTLGRVPVTTTVNGNIAYHDVLTYGGARAQYTVTREVVYFSTNFGQSDVTESYGSFDAIQSIQLPDGSTYSFTYDSGTTSGHYGELTSMTLPSGGVIDFNYTIFEDSFNNDNMWLSSVTKDGGTTTYTPMTLSAPTYCPGYSYCEEVTAKSPDGNATTYIFSLDSSAFANGGSWNTVINAFQGDQSGAPKLKSVDTTYTYTTQQYQNADGTESTYEIPQTQTVQTSLYSYPTILTAQTVTTLDAVGANPTDVKEWDYYQGSPPASPTLETVYTYGETVNGANLPTEIEVLDGSGTEVNDTQIAYGYDHGDGSPQPAPEEVGHFTPTGPYGDVTSVSRWINNTGTYLTTSATYDNAGAILTLTVPNGQTTYGHDNSDTFVTSVTPPTPSSGVSLTWNAAYDFWTGLLTSTTDPNGETTNYSNYDAFGRVGEIDYPDGGKTTFSYTPTQASTYQYQNGSVYADTEILYDNYERKSRVAVANGQSGSSWYQNDMCYDEDGRVSFESYTYQGTGFGMSKVCSGAGDAINYDALSRPTAITHGDGTSISYTYQLRATETTDENGVSRIVQTNIFGQPTGICEISSNGSMPGSGSPAACGLDIAGTGFLTTFEYYLSSHSFSMWEGAQVRSFQTDSLGRPYFTNEPESGQTTYSYVYNSTGLQVTRTRPEANQTNSSVTTTTTTQYDTLGRPVSITYSDGTPSKSFSYDLASQWGITLQNVKGRLAAISTSANTGAIYGYDAMGRVTLRNECTPSNCGTNSFQTNYTYDGVGNLLSSSDGFVTDSYTYSVANELLSITSSLNDSNDPPDVVSSVQNGPFGPLSWQLGNGLSGVRQYDSMGRVTGGWVCQGSTQSYCTGGTQVYGFTDGWKGPYMTSACDTVLNACSNYQYDEFGRLGALNTYQGNWPSYTYVYDRWGNRWEQNLTSGSGPAPQLSFNTSNNQITNSGYAYDAAGDLIADGAHNYSYDAEGNLTLVDGGSTAKYTYDALNQRVRIDDAGQPSTEYIFNPFGQRAAVWDATDGWQSQGQTYWGSAPVEYYNNGYAHYQDQDWLGTERMGTNNAGQVEGTYTSLPFGDAFNVNGTDDDQYHFAGMDYDYNSGYNGTAHAQFRQYDNSDGSWMSPDPYGGSYDFTNPQSFNRYSYVMNNPTSFFDPEGLDGGEGGAVASTGTCGAAVGSEGVDLPADVFCALGLVNFFEGLFGIPTFHGTLKPRPNDQPWDEYHIHYGPNIAAALGLPDETCDFGACGDIVFGAEPAQGGWEIDKRPLKGLGALGQSAVVFHYFFYNTKTHQSIGLGPGKGSGMFCPVPGTWETSEHQGILYEQIPASMQDCVNKTIQQDLKTKPQNYFFWNSYGSTSAENCNGYVMSVIERCD